MYVSVYVIDRRCNKTERAGTGQPPAKSVAYSVQLYRMCYTYSSNAK